MSAELSHRRIETPAATVRANPPARADDPEVDKPWIPPLELVPEPDPLPLVVEPPDTAVMLLPVVVVVIVIVVLTVVSF